MHCIRAAAYTGRCSVITCSCTRRAAADIRAALQHDHVFVYAVADDTRAADDTGSAAAAARSAASAIFTRPRGL